MVRIFKFSDEGAVFAFTEFKSESCAQAFLYFNEQTGFLRLGRLPSDIILNQQLPVHRVPLWKTPHKIAHHAETGTYAVLLSEPALYHPPLPKPTDDIPDPEPLPELDDTQIQPTNNQFELRLLSQVNKWAALDSFSFEPNEQALALCCVNMRVVTPPLNGAPARVSTRSLIVVGTGITHGELHPVKGRLILFDVAKQAVDEVSEHGQLSLLVSMDHPCPVTALAQLEGHLIASVGTRLFVYRWDDSKAEMVPCSFHDAKLYTVSISTCKNFVLVGDVLKSMHLLVWREKGKRLTLIASDFNDVEVLSTEFWVSGQQLGFAMTDSLKNISLFKYNKSDGGRHLVEQLDSVSQINTGAHIHKLERVRSLPSSAAGAGTSHSLVFGTLEGGFGTLTPIDERVFKRLFMLQLRMLKAVPQFAGMNQEAFHAHQPYHYMEADVKQHIVSGDLLCQYMNLNVALQNELALSIGTTSRRILDNLTEIARITALY